jgi:hypothetical protein
VVVVIDAHVAEGVPARGQRLRRVAPDAQLEAADPAAHALVENHGHAIRPRIDGAEEGLRVGQRGHVPRRVGGSGRAQRRQDGAERHETRLGHVHAT